MLPGLVGQPVHIEPLVGVGAVGEVTEHLDSRRARHLTTWMVATTGREQDADDRHEEEGANPPARSTLGLHGALHPTHSGCAAFGQPARQIKKS